MENVRYRVRAEYYHIVDSWWYDDEAKARAKYAELLALRPRWDVTLSAVETGAAGRGGQRP